MEEIKDFAQASDSICLLFEKDSSGSCEEQTMSVWVCAYGLTWMCWEESEEDHVVGYCSIWQVILNIKLTRAADGLAVRCEEKEGKGNFIVFGLNAR